MTMTTTTTRRLRDYDDGV